MFKEIIISMRPKQWYKNLVLFIGIIFSLNFMDFQLWSNTILGFIIFCVLSGSEYIINDIIDKEKDRKHPKKRKRPIASGRLKVSYALIFAVIAVFLALIGAYLINVKFLIISVMFFLLILSYSLVLKHLIIVDILVISMGFVVRAVAGCLAINVFISPWLIICAFLLALFLALGKRRHEMFLLGKGAKTHRKVLKDYSVQMLDQMTSIITGALIVSYSLYTFLTDNIYMMLTVPFVIYGLFRYLFLIHMKNFGGEVEIIFKDKGMLICMSLWIVLTLIVLYLF